MSDLAERALKCYYQVKYAAAVKTQLVPKPTKVVNPQESKIFEHTMMRSQGNLRARDYPAVRHPPPPRPASEAGANIKPNTAGMSDPLSATKVKNQ